MNETALEIQNISKAFLGEHALRNVSLSVRRGSILGLVGENGAGKSTLMNIIGGVIQADTGAMRLDGETYAPRRAADANQAGIAFIHQELNLFTNLSIAENIFINDFPQRRVGFLKTIDRPAMRQQTRQLLERVDLSLAPDTLVERLSPGERQLVEIAAALRFDASLMIFDEPTTSLTNRETETLFELINRLRSEGKTIIYISHILADVIELADEIAVLRDGELIDTLSKDQFAINDMIALMVGRNIEQLYPPRASTPSVKPVLQAKDVSASGIIKDIDFTLYSGEVLGLFGLMGSGRTELARILFGMDSFESGEIVIQDKTIHHASPRRSIQNRMAFITENRREEGLLMTLPISENIGLTSLPQFASTPLRVIADSRLLEAANQMVTTLRVRSAAIEHAMAKSLSGGNQQKVVFAKWLMSRPSIFIMDEPTRGVDVGAKYEIYTIINDLAAEGKGILFISSELEELMGMCDRILVMSQGEFIAEFEQSAFDKERILRAAFREGNDPL